MKVAVLKIYKLVTEKFTNMKPGSHKKNFTNGELKRLSNYGNTNYSH